VRGAVVRHLDADTRLFAAGIICTFKSDGNKS
jgi:hypothetical protein